MLKADGKIVLLQNGWGNDAPYRRFFAPEQVWNARVITGFQRTAPNVSEVTVYTDYQITVRSPIEMVTFTSKAEYAIGSTESDYQAPQYLLFNDQVAHPDMTATNKIWCYDTSDSSGASQTVDAFRIESICSAVVCWPMRKKRALPLNIIETTRRNSEWKMMHRNAMKGSVIVR